MRRILPGLLLATVLLGCTPVGPGPSPSPVSVPSAAPSSSTSAAATPSPAAPTPLATQPGPSPTATSPTAGATPSPAPVCLATQLEGTVTRWEGAAGHQVASVVLGNGSSTACTVQGTPRLQLVDARGAVLIDSEAAGPGGLPHVDPSDEVFTLDPGARIATAVSVADYCGDLAPALPTTIAFVLPSDAGRLVVAPGPGGDVPSCMSSPGAPGSIEMNGWTR